MKAKTGFSKQTDSAAAVASLKQSLGDPDVKLVLYFASSQYEPATLARQMAAAFPDAALLGCTTAGEIVSGHLFDQSLVAMALGSELVKQVHVALAENVATDARSATKAALSRLETSTGSKLPALDAARVCGLILCDGLSGAEETIMDELGNQSDLTFIGGSAGDDLQFKRTHVFVGGKTYSNVAALALLELCAPFRVIKTQSFRVLPTALIATRVNEKAREVLEFDGRPAAEAYASALGVPVASLAEQFMRHPLGLMAEGEPFVRSPQAVVGSAVRFYCQILEGMQLQVLESTDIVADTARALEAVGEPSALLNFHCILRTLELKAKGQSEAYGDLFQRVPTLGFSTYGEAYIGHINQTSTILVIDS